MYNLAFACGLSHHQKIAHHHKHQHHGYDLDDADADAYSDPHDAAGHNDADDRDDQ